MCSPAQLEAPKSSWRSSTGDEFPAALRKLAGKFRRREKTLTGKGLQ
jgi:hypothetical protein